MKNITINTAAVLQTANQIKAYLEERPNAADTVEGIHNFWISSLASLETTVDALEHLEEEGLVEQWRLGNQLVWRKSKN